MVYITGKDVDVFITTEDTDGPAFVFSLSGAAAALSLSATDPDIVLNPAKRLFASNLSGSLASTASGQIDLTGVDLSIGATDEDITYIGFRQVTKAEIKKETTVALTRKKQDTLWDLVFNTARFGISGASAGALAAFPGLEEPTVNHGYRIHVQLKDGTEAIAVPNAYITGHTVSVSVDGTADETLEFMSYITPKFANSSSANTAATSGSQL